MAENVLTATAAIFDWIRNKSWTRKFLYSSTRFLSTENAPQTGTKTNTPDRRGKPRHQSCF